MFKLYSKFKPTGDQPQAIKKITNNLRAGVKKQVLLGVTGSGKTFVMSNVIEHVQKPTLVITFNKLLAAQLYQEFKEFFPENAVHYFVSYYDYYQPEAYIPQTDTYIEKDAKINEQIDRLRHAAVQDLLERKDVIVVASVSCIYNIGSPETYQKISLEIKQGQEIKRQKLLSILSALQYQRNDIDFYPGTFRVRGDTIEIFTVTGKETIKIELWGEKIEEIIVKKTIKKNVSTPIRKLRLYPAKFWLAPQEKLNIAIENIKLELQERLKELYQEKKALEAQRLKERTNYDLEMMQETGYCHGIENYSRHLEFRQPGEPPFTLLDYFPGDYIVFIDESHMTVPQLHAMYNTDRQRKETLIKYGFRLPSALDNRPLNFEEFEKKVKQIVFVSATPGPYEMGQIKHQKSKLLVEELIRPTGLLEPSIEIRPANPGPEQIQHGVKNQVQDLIEEIKRRTKLHQRTLVITLTKHLAEELADYLQEEGIKTHYLHSEIKTLERPEILEKLRRGEYDVIVGINLLREGLDLPEVALIAILDADKEGFLRNKTTLIQTMGRAARNPNGHCILYADKLTGSMKEACREIERRRKIQIAYNKKHHITPKAIVKPIREWAFRKKKEVYNEFGTLRDINLLKKEMLRAAQKLDFERAAEIRDLIKKIKEEK